MSYTAIYRKYRPQSFDDIVGQNAIVQTLKNQIKSQKIGHAYLFCGMRGTGKTSTARVFSKALNCIEGPTIKTCNKCPACKAIERGGMIDVIEMDAASNRGIDDIRDLREKVNFPPTEGRYKVYIIDEVHMLTTEAFNALLKTLEEPPSFVVFILATTEPEKLPDTILSRCMRFDFKRVTTNDLVKKMEEISKDMKVKAEQRALALIAENSQGSVRDALSLLDKAVAFGGGKLSYRDVLDVLGAVDKSALLEISRKVLQQDGKTILNILDDILKEGRDITRFIDDLLTHYRNILMVKLGVDRNLLNLIDEDIKELEDIAKEYTKEKLLCIIDILKDAGNDIKWTSKPRTIVEAALIKLILPELWDEKPSFIARVQELEKKVQILSKTIKDLVEREPTSIQNSTNKDQRKTVSNDVKKDKPKGTFTERKLNKKKQELVRTEKPSGDKENLGKIVDSWSNIIKLLEEQREKVLQMAIIEGNIKPYRLDGNKLYFSCKNIIFKEMFEGKSKLIENMIKKVTGLDVFIASVEKEASTDVKEKELEATQKESKQTDKVGPEEDFSKEVIDLFGEDIVTFED